MSFPISFTLYTAEWCKPCAQFKKKYFGEFKESFPEVKYTVIDIEDTNEDVSEISSIPTVVIEKGRKRIVYRRVLSQIDKIRDCLEELSDV